MEINSSLSLLPQDGEAFYFKHFFSEHESRRLFEELLAHILWRQEPIKIFGKSILQPRLTAWYGDLTKPYRYSGIEMTPHAWTKPLLEIKERIEQASQTQFTSVLLNLYRDQKDSMGWHRDNEKELGPNPTIGSVSFGATRTFCFRHYSDHKLKSEVELSDGSFLLMRGTCQHFWEHSLPKRTRSIGPRINLTFRSL